MKRSNQNVFDVLVQEPARSGEEVPLMAGNHNRLVRQTEKSRDIFVKIT